MLLQNKILITGCIAWLISQFTKAIIYLIINKRFIWERLLGDGGMPSSHSATVTAVAVMTGLRCGWDSPVFAIATVLALVVMHDAMGVRQETGKQAILINELVDIVEKLKIEHRLPTIELKEFVGHTPLQVAAGILLGFLDALLMYFVVFA
jgi:acid phosphatase family membrane protein YuiD